MWWLLTEKCFSHWFILRKTVSNWNKNTTLAGVASHHNCKKQTKKQHNSQCFQSEADSHQTFNCYANTAFTGNNKYCIRFRTKFHFFFCLLVFASTLSSAILYTEHVFAFKDILLVSQTSSLDENASESKQQAVIPANNGRYCGEIFLTKLTLHHCFKISLNTV